jgi:hypothetical protein
MANLEATRAILAGTIGSLRNRLLMKGGKAYRNDTVSARVTARTSGTGSEQ